MPAVASHDVAPVVPLLIVLSFADVSSGPVSRSRNFAAACLLLAGVVEFCTSAGHSRGDHF